MQRVLITGGSGLLALNWACCMRATCEIFLAEHTKRIALQGAHNVPLDLESIPTLEQTFAHVKPDLVVHTAGLTSVDECEEHPVLAHHLNVTLAANVARATQRLGIALVHISTDHLFAGTRSLYRENDPPAPLNVYGRTKLEAEHAVASIHPGALVIRTNFFGWGHRYRQSFSDRILLNLRQNRVLSMFDDVFFTPILVDSLVRAVHELVSRSESGLYNVAGDERLSKYDFAMRMADAYGLPAALVQRASISTFGAKAARPKDMSLDNSRSVAAIGRRLGSIDEFLRELKDQECDGRALELNNSISR